MVHLRISSKFQTKNSSLPNKLHSKPGLVPTEPHQGRNRQVQGHRSCHPSKPQRQERTGHRDSAGLFHKDLSVIIIPFITQTGRVARGFLEEEVPGRQNDTVIVPASQQELVKIPRNSSERKGIASVDR
ncbi:hypothetical protein CapIbe_023535 [Capra ibex]